MPGVKYSSIEQYVSDFPAPIRAMMKELHQVIQEVVPDAEATISYNMPAFKLHGSLVYYGGGKNHVGFYPGDSTTTNLFKDELVKYKTSVAAIQFPVGEPIPHKLVKKIVKYRVQVNKELAAAKAAKAPKKKKV
jgi:uncharacterized protein YdhG (YjbR/CyaY superfamily)